MRAPAIRLAAALSAALICGPAAAQEPAGGWSLRAAERYAKEKRPVILGRFGTSVIHNCEE